ncbi:MAG TPA: helix-turn-helix transcriptional regulator [Acidobacteriaceae bacterium]|nr:helix-turn-helix transcriptional regulator [Acidobacteriaceae bacterium]
MVRRLRHALRMSQQQLATELGLSVASIRAYEAGQKVSEGSLEKLKSLAARKMLPDFAIELDGREFKVRAVYEPGKKVRMPRVPAGEDLGDVMHRMLDEVIESGQPEIIVAVESVLQVCRIALTSNNSASKTGKSGGK